MEKSITRLYECEHIITRYIFLLRYIYFLMYLLSWKENRHLCYNFPHRYSWYSEVNVQSWNERFCLCRRAPWFLPSRHVIYKVISIEYDNLTAKIDCVIIAIIHTTLLINCESLWMPIARNTSAIWTKHKILMAFHCHSKRI